MLIEGYASRWGEVDGGGDVVRAGAFTRSLAGGRWPRLLLQHRGRDVGRWLTVREDGVGLFVRGMITNVGVRRSVERTGLGGLSIGFVARDWSPRIGRGRTLISLELMEVSLVAEPMLATARFRVVAGNVLRAVG